MSEKDLPKDLQFVEREPLVTGSAAAPAQDFDRYQGAILSAPLGLDTDIAKSQLPGANPAYRLMPSSIAGNPQSNASIQSTAAKTIAVTPGPSVEGTESVTLNVPSIFTPVSQTQDLPDATLGFSLAPELPHTFLAASIPGLTSLTGIFSNSHSPTPATNATITFTPPSAGWALYMESLAGNINSNISGWTAWGDASALSISSTSPVTATDTASTSFSWCNIVATFSGTIPTFVSNHQSTFTIPPGSTSVSVSQTITPSAGNFLVVAIYGTVASTGNFSGYTISDSKGDSFSQIAVANAGASSFNGPVALNVLVAPNIVGGSTTITATINGLFPAGSAFILSVSEVTPFAAGSGLPLFRTIASTDLPSLSAQNLSNGTTGTGAIVLAASPTLTGTLAAGSETLTGKITNYNSIATVSNGVPSEIATVDLTGQTAAIGTTTLYAVPASGAGQYELSWNAKVTTPDGASSTLGALTIVYTDPDGVVQTITAAAQNKNGTIETTDTGNTTTTVMLGLTMMLNCKASTNITYAMGYASGTPATMTYNLHLKLKAL